MYNTVLFDLDGCLVHSLPAWVVSYKESFAKHGVHKSDEEVVYAIYHFDESVVPVVKDIETFTNDVYERFHEHLDLIELHEDVEHTLKKLKESNKKLGVVTSSWRKTASYLLQRLKIDTYFDIVMAWEDTERNKPYPDPILQAMDKLQSKRDSTIMIGDSDADIIAAQQAGVASVWYHPHHNELFFAHDHFAHLNPTHTVKHMRDLVRIINNLV